MDGEWLRVRVTAPPEAGRANEALIAVLAAALGIAKSRVRIVRGHTARTKQVEIEGMEQQEALSRLVGTQPR